MRRTNRLYSGMIDVKSINTSFCKSYSDSGIQLFLPTNISNITYSSFCNTSSQYSAIGLNNGDFKFKFCNVLDNKIAKSQYGTFWAGSSTYQIENSSFLGNIGLGVDFYQESYGSITIQDSFCDRLNKTAGLVITNNVQNTYSFSKLSIFSTDACIFDINIMTYDEDIYKAFFFVMIPVLS